MRRIEAIRTNPTYIECYRRTLAAEEGRMFCCHQMEHLLDVARIAYIYNLEEQLGLDKELIYAAALLHDIGKFCQYEDGTPHETAGAAIAEQILQEMPEKVAFTSEEKWMILDAIRGHRRQSEGMGVLARLLYRSDKKSRSCFACEMQAECKWSAEKMNMQIEI